MLQKILHNPLNRFFPVYFWPSYLCFAYCFADSDRAFRVIQGSTYLHTPSVSIIRLPLHHLCTNLTNRRGHINNNMIGHLCHCFRLRERAVPVPYPHCCKAVCKEWSYFGLSCFHVRQSSPGQIPHSQEGPQNAYRREPRIGSTKMKFSQVTWCGWELLIPTSPCGPLPPQAIVCLDC